MRQDTAHKPNVPGPFDHLPELPKQVHVVGKYCYWQPFRGTPLEWERERIPGFRGEPVFEAALAKHKAHFEVLLATGKVPVEAPRRVRVPKVEPAVLTLAQVIELFLSSEHYKGLADSTRDTYARYLSRSAFSVKNGYGDLPAGAFTPVHTRQILEGWVKRGKLSAGNAAVGALQGLSQWGMKYGPADGVPYFERSLTEGVKQRPLPKGRGRKPWSPEQQATAKANLTGMLLRAYYLYRHTGQRGCDIVELGEKNVHPGGRYGVLQLTTIKTKRDVFVHIDRELHEQIAAWKAEDAAIGRISPTFLYQTGGNGRAATSKGKKFQRRLIGDHLARERAEIEGLEGVEWHGLRATRVVELRRAGMTELEIEDMVGMSASMVKRYTQNDNKADAAAAAYAKFERLQGQNNG